MEQEIRNLTDWVHEVRQILPLLATKEDLKAFATKEDLKVLATKEELKGGIDEAKRYTEHHILVVRRELRQVDEKVTAMAADIKGIAEQLQIIVARRRR